MQYPNPFPMGPEEVTYDTATVFQELTICAEPRRFTTTHSPVGYRRLLASLYPVFHNDAKIGPETALFLRSEKLNMLFGQLCRVDDPEPVPVIERSVPRHIAKCC